MGGLEFCLHGAARRRAGGASPGRAARSLGCDLVLVAGFGDLGVLEGGPDVDRDPTVRARLFGFADRNRHAAATARAHHLVLRQRTHLLCSSYTLPTVPLA